MSPCVIVSCLLHDGRCLFQQNSFDGLTRGSGRNVVFAHHGPTRLTVSQYCMEKPTPTVGSAEDTVRGRESWIS